MATYADYLAEFTSDDARQFRAAFGNTDEPMTEAEWVDWQNAMNARKARMKDYRIERLAAEGFGPNDLIEIEGIQYTVYDVHRDYPDQSAQFVFVKLIGTAHGSDFVYIALNKLR